MLLFPGEMHKQTQACSQECVSGYIFHHVLSSRLIARLYRKPLSQTSPDPTLTQASPSLWFYL